MAASFLSKKHAMVCRVTLEGEVSVVAGTGKPGEVDGDAATALPRIPNGLTASRDGAELYVVSGVAGQNCRFAGSAYGDASGSGWITGDILGAQTDLAAIGAGVDVRRKVER